MEYNSAVFLVTLADMKEYLDITDTTDDGKIGRLLQIVAKELDMTCNRTFLEAAHTEYRDGNGTEELWLKNAPVSLITSVSYDSKRQFAADTVLDSTAYFLDSELGRLISNIGPWNRGIRNYKVVYPGGYTQANVPQDLQVAVMERVLQFWKRMKEKRVDETSRSSEGGSSRSFMSEPWPEAVWPTVERYIRSG